MNKHILKLLRPHQWLKNGFVFTPLFFDRHATDWQFIWPSIVIFVAFCLAASGIYCFNDIHDAAADRQHPLKRMRPVASGAIGKGTAYTIMAVLWIAVFALLALCRFDHADTKLNLCLVLLFYVIMNIAYCVKLKEIAILDVIIIAIGFVLRIVAGGVATGIFLSHWIILTTFLLALFLALAKRRDDIVIYQQSEGEVKPRKNVDRYNLNFLDQAITIMGSVTIVCYILYTVSEEVVERIGSPYLYVTSLFVLTGILRYMQLTFVDKKSGSPTKVLIADHIIQACVVCWIAAFVIILYL